jgi:citrate synthase
MAVWWRWWLALSAFFHEDLDTNDPHHRMIASYRLIAKIPRSRHVLQVLIGQPFMYPRTT